MGDWALLGGSLLLVLACGLFVAAEFSFLGANRAEIEAAAEAGDSQSRGVFKALTSLSTQLSGAQVGITITNLAIGFLAEPAIGRMLDPLLLKLGISGAASTAISSLVALTIATIVTMVLGELIPKNLAIAHPEAVAKVVQGPMRAFTVATKPISGGLNAVANWLVRRLGVEPSEELAAARNPQELLSLVRRSAEQGSLSFDTAGLLRNALTFDDKTASDAMTPRTKVKYLPSSASMLDLLDAARDSGRTRFPVAGTQVDEVVGVVSVVDAFEVDPDRRRLVSVGSVALRTESVPSSLPLDDVLRRMLASGSQLVVVVDEFGGMDGVISLEDLVEELVGDLEDETDRSEHMTTRQHGDEWSLSALLRPDEVAEQTGLVIAGSPVYETLGGFVIAHLGRLAEVGDKVVVRGVECEVTATEKRRIDRVTIRVVDQQLVQHNDDQPAGGRS